MTEGADNLVLIDLRRLDEKVDRLIDVHDLESRMTAVEENLAGVHRRLDRLELRVERRLELAETPH